MITFVVTNIKTAIISQCNMVWILGIYPYFTLIKMNPFGCSRVYRLLFRLHKKNVFPPSVLCASLIPKAKTSSSFTGLIYTSVKYQPIPANILKGWYVFFSMLFHHQLFYIIRQHHFWSLLRLSTNAYAFDGLVYETVRPILPTFGPGWQSI